jgi:hypothetical protein
LRRTLWDSAAISKIVDHRNYNPRIIEAMTDRLNTGKVSPTDYAAAFIHALDNPHQLWDTAFRTHIRPVCRHLLFTLFFCSQYGAEIDDLKTAFNALHPRMCKIYNISHEAKDFEEALKILEGGFIAISGDRISFINPSLRDYMTDYLNDTSLLVTLASTARKADWAQSLWQHVQVRKELPSDQQQSIALAFKPIAAAFQKLPVTKKDPADPTVYRFYDLSLSDRISLLLSWARVTGDAEFMTYALQIAERPLSFTPWRDGVELVSLIRSLRQGEDADLPSADDLAAKLEDRVVTMFQNHMWPDDLDRIYSAVEDERDLLAADVFDAANEAIVRGIDDAREDAASIESASALADHIKAFERLAPRAGIPPEKLKTAISAIESRISEIEEGVEEASSPEFSGKLSRAPDWFDDAALRNLFAPLVAS